MSIFNNKLLDKYFDPKLGLKSIDKFAKQQKLSKSQVQKLKSLEVFQMHKQPKRNKKLYHSRCAVEQHPSRLDGCHKFASSSKQKSPLLAQHN